MRQILIETVESSREREQFFIERCGDVPADPGGRWSVKDHVAHLTSWREHASSVLEAAARGEAYHEDDDIDARNAATYARTKDRRARDVVAHARRSYARLLDAIAACDEPALQRPRDGRPGEIWRVVPGNGHLHVGEHLVQWHLETRDQPAAEQVAAWVHELDLRFTDRESRANALYNRACMLARFGRSDDAVEMLRRAFDEASPSLKAWAREDGDLRELRGRADVRAMLAP